MMPKLVLDAQVKFCAVQTGGEWRTVGQVVSRCGWVSKGFPSTSIRPFHHFRKPDGLRFFFFLDKKSAEVSPEIDGAVLTFSLERRAAILSACQDALRPFYP
jgi:hypothetical protein